MRKLLFILFLGLRFANAQTSTLCIQVDCRDTVQLPVDSASLNAVVTATDAVKSSVWSQVIGPSASVLTGGSTLTALSSKLKVGMYVFQMTVTTVKGTIATAFDTIVVQPAINIPPIVSAGPNVTALMPPNSVPMLGSATDLDGTIVSYKWAQVSGPSTSILAPVNASCIASGLVTGVYVFSLTVTDNSGASATATTQVTVSNAPKSVKQITIIYTDGSTSTIP